MQVEGAAAGAEVLSRRLEPRLWPLMAPPASVMVPLPVVSNRPVQASPNAGQSPWRISVVAFTLMLPPAFTMPFELTLGAVEDDVPVTHAGS